MNFRTMTKEQKQRLILGVLLGAVGLVVAGTLVVQPMSRKWTATKKEYEGLVAKLDDANKLLKRELDMREDLADKEAELGHVVEECIPDPENPASWVTQRVSGYARKAGIDIRSVSAAAARSAPLDDKKDGPKRSFSMFEVHIIAQCTYGGLLEFLEEMETRNPYLCVSGLLLSGQPTSPEIHNTSIDLQWPIWKDLETAQEAQERIGGEHG